MTLSFEKVGPEVLEREYNPGIPADWGKFVQ